MTKRADLIISIVAVGVALVALGLASYNLADAVQR